jgi:hypothetical protein
MLRLDAEEAVLNYRLSTARTTVECAFGVLSAKWRILKEVINFDPDNAVNVVKYTCVFRDVVNRYGSATRGPS